MHGVRLPNLGMQYLKNKLKQSLEIICFFIGHSYLDEEYRERGISGYHWHSTGAVGCDRCGKCNFCYNMNSKHEYNRWR